MLRTNRARSVGLLLIFGASAITGCFRGSGTTEPSIISAEAPVKMTVKVRGDVEIDFDHEVPSTYSMVRSGSSGGSVEVLGVRPLDALRSGSAAFVPGMSVTPYKGDGKYVVERSADGQQAGGAAVGPKSSVTLVWWPTGDLASDPFEFRQHVENCVISISNDGRSGHAKCSKVSTPKGDRTISIDFKWKAPKLKAETRVTEPSTSSTEPSSSTSSSAP
jgi:hypothetical protein